MISRVLMAVTVAVPLASVVIEMVSGASIPERHHTHHDTYLVTPSYTRALVASMIFMGVVGLLLGWMCAEGVFQASESVVFAFFSAFLLVVFVMWLGVRRYRVTTYDDHMVVRPFVGRTVTIPYEDVDLIRWKRQLDKGRNRRLQICWGGHKITLLDFFDLDQILARVNRYNAHRNL